MQLQAQEKQQTEKYTNIAVKQEVFIKYLALQTRVTSAEKRNIPDTRFIERLCTSYEEHYFGKEEK